mmetsp:Transcript_21131/g.66141  ORF Transcript_21131/g.66141 Transcript_21131/m.66141 type:complete len:237 (+) Transcript_21131:425-1135(+)
MMCGCVYETAARATRERCPPLSAEEGTACCFSSTPHVARCERSACSCAYEPSPGKRSIRNWSGESVRSIWSAWCWLTRATRAPPARTTSPAVGARSPSSSLTSVVFPLPFSPSSTIREVASTPSSAPEKSCSPEAEYPNATPRSCTRGPEISPPAWSESGSSWSSCSAAASSSSSACAASSFSACRSFIFWRETSEPPYLKPWLAYVLSLVTCSARSAVALSKVFCCCSRRLAHVA